MTKTDSRTDRGIIGLCLSGSSVAEVVECRIYLKRGFHKEGSISAVWNSSLSFDIIEIEADGNCCFTAASLGNQDNCLGYGRSQQEEFDSISDMPPDEFIRQVEIGSGSWKIFLSHGENFSKQRVGNDEVVVCAVSGPVLNMHARVSLIIVVV